MREQSHEEEGHVHDKQVLEGVVQYGWKAGSPGRNGRLCKERKLKTVHVICRRHCKMTIRIKSFFGNVLGC